MRITIDGKQYKIPASLMDVTLSERIEFDQQYGKELKKQLLLIHEMKDDVFREVEFTDYHLQLACKTLSFFGKIPLDIVQNTQIEEVLTIYHHTMKGFSEDVDFLNKEFELQNEFHWKDETWEITAPTLRHDSLMSFAEFLDAKQSVQNLYEFGEEKYGALLVLCCIYFRKKNESYNKEFIIEKSERYELMKQLPMSYALHMGFFLANFQSLWLRTFQYSGNHKAKAQAEM